MNNQNQVNNIVKALGYTENGGAPDINNPSAGKTGETASIFQFEPATWKAYSQQVFGQEVPMNADTETAVVQKKVSDWLDKGYTPDQIASMWNAGPGEPNAYTGKFSDGTSSTGVNAKYGVAYSVPQYVDKFNKYLGEFQGSNTNDQTANSTPPNTGNPQINTGEQSNPAEANKQQALQKVIASIQSVSNQGQPQAQQTPQSPVQAPPQAPQQAPVTPTPSPQLQQPLVPTQQSQPSQGLVSHIIKKKKSRT